MAQVLDQSEVSLANQALLRVRAAPIESIDSDTSKRAVTVRQFFAPTRDAMLRRYHWNFAKAFATLPAESGVTVPAGFTNLFTLPADCLKLRRVNGVDLYYVRDKVEVIKDRRIAATLSAPLKIEYTAQITNTQEWDALFAQAFAAALAARLAKPLAQDERLVRETKEEARIAWLEALPADAAEGVAEPLDEGTWAAVIGYG